MMRQYFSALSMAIVESAADRGKSLTSHVGGTLFSPAQLEAARAFLRTLSAGEVRLLSGMVFEQLKQLDGAGLVLNSLLQQLEKGKVGRSSSHAQLPVPLWLAKAVLQEDHGTLKVAPAVQVWVKHSLLEWASSRKGAR